MYAKDTSIPVKHSIVTMVVLLKLLEKLSGLYRCSTNMPIPTYWPSFPIFPWYQACQENKQEEKLLMMQLQVQLLDIIAQIIIMVSTEEKSEKWNGKNSKTSKPYNVSKWFSLDPMLIEWAASRNLTEMKNAKSTFSSPLKEK